MSRWLRLLLRTGTLMLLAQNSGLVFAASEDGSPDANRPDDIVDVTEVMPEIALDIRYFGRHNFVGRPIPGYQAPKCLLTRQAAEALAQVQAELLDRGYQLKLYDCYRPQRAVDSFVAWAKTSTTSG